MCGIFGVIHDENTVEVSKLQKVSDSIAHRGPDGEGFLLIQGQSASEYAGKITPKKGLEPIPNGMKSTSCLLHRRLSIFDLSELGHQPMQYAGSNVWLTFNGEIYNFKEIRAELQSKGYAFKSTTDSEVILAAYLEWNTECVKRFNGMWAFAIWDGRDDSWFLSRDRLGIKPLYTTLKNNRLVFASEIKAILAYDETLAKINKRKVAEYLTLGQVVIGESMETMFEDIHQLLPGSNLMIKNGTVTTEKFWNLEVKVSNKNRHDHLEEFSYLFQDSLKLRMQSDVELGSCLSGGLDSSSIVSLGTKLSGKSMNTFSAVWPGTRHDESQFMKIVNDSAKAKPHYCTIKDDDVLGLIDRVTWHQEIPIPGSSLLAQWTVMEAAREAQVPVLLDGQGADEVLSGYPIYNQVYFNELLSGLKLRDLQELLSNSSNTGVSMKSMLKRHVKNALGKYSKPKIDLRNANLAPFNSNITYRHALDCFFLPNFLVDQITKSNLPSLLHFEDRNSMAHSVEARVPFLDYRLVELGVNIPSHQKIGEGFTKTILRDCMKGTVPDTILNRRDKVGFTTPFEDRLMSSNHPLVNAVEYELAHSHVVISLGIDLNHLNVNQKFRVYLLSRFVASFAIDVAN